MRLAIRLALLAAALSLAPGGGARGQQADPAADVRLVIKVGHSEGVTAVAVSADGRFVATAGHDGTAILWDARTAKQLLAFTGHAGWLTSVALSPDGKRLLTGSDDNTARLWDVDTGKSLHVLKGHEKRVTSVAFSPDGERALTGSYDHTARLWDAKTGKPLSTIKAHTQFVTAAVFSPDGKRLVTGSQDKTAIVWDTESRKPLATLKGHTNQVLAVAFSPDGKRVLTGSQDSTARVWDAESGNSQATLKGHTGYVLSVAFSPDGARALTAATDATARLWDAESGKVQLTLKGHDGRVNGVAFSPDGARVVTGGGDQTARLWDARTGKGAGSLRGGAASVTAAAFAPDGAAILTGSADRALRLWDGVTGKQQRVFKTAAPVTAAAFWPDGQRVLAGVDDSTARVWDARTGKELVAFRGHADRVLAVAVSPDGKLVVTGAADQTARLWDGQTGKPGRSLPVSPFGGGAHVVAVAFAPDGKRVATGSNDNSNTAKLWETASGKFLLGLKGHEDEVSAVGFSPDGKRVLTGSHDATARLWDAANGKELRKFAGHTSEVTCAVLSADAKQALTGSTDHTARLWDAATGKTLFVLKGHTGVVRAVSVAPDGKRLLTAGDDKTTRLWDAAAGKELCRMVGFPDGSWAVVDPAGRYDASNGGDVEGLHWVVANQPVALDQLKDRYYDPGLLAKYLGLNTEPPRDVKALSGAKPHPAVAVAQADPTKPQFRVDVTNAGGGIGRVVVLVNGKESNADARAPGADPDAKKQELAVDLSSDPRLAPGKKNTVEVVAYNADGSLASRGMVREFDAPGATPADPPQLYAVVAGVSKYNGEKLNLRYAAKDADDFATALELAAGRLFDRNKVHVTRLTGATDEARPGRAALEKALAGLKDTKPSDLVVVYLAGHGVTQGGQDGDWHYLSADAQSGDLSDPAVRKQVSVSSRELTDWLKAAPAQKQVLILDTCHSGRLIEKLTEKRDVPGSQVRALERVKDRTGMHVLAGCAADSVSYEASRYGQGLLTYSLLQGMRGAKLRDGEYVDVVELFGHAADKVPELAREIGGVQRPLIASPRGTSFDIGRLTAEDRAKVPLQAVKPVVLRTKFLNEKLVSDDLDLSRRVDRRLLDLSAVPRGTPLVFVDAADFPEGLKAAGLYKVEGDKVTVRVALSGGTKDVEPFTVEGTAGKPDEFAEKIAAEVEKRLAAAGGK
jgi:WD40 repeat protein